MFASPRMLATEVFHVLTLVFIFCQGLYIAIVLCTEFVVTFYAAHTTSEVKEKKNLAFSNFLKEPFLTQKQTIH